MWPRYWLELIILSAHTVAEDGLAIRVALAQDNGQSYVLEVWHKADDGFIMAHKVIFIIWHKCYVPVRKSEWHFNLNTYSLLRNAVRVTCIYQGCARVMNQTAICTATLTNICTVMDNMGSTDNRLTAGGLGASSGYASVYPTASNNSKHMKATVI